MLDGNENEKASIDEQYSGSVGASNLRIEADRRTAGDMIVAAGMSPHRTGLALMRLMTEWDASSKPIPMDAAAVERLASTYEREPPMLGDKKNPHAGLVRREAKKQGDPDEYLIPTVLAAREAAAWHVHELKILLQRMKTLPEVRDALIHKSRELDLEDGEHAVGAVLIWWLSPTCPVCKGRKYKVAAGTGRTSSKLCTPCKGTGEKTVPHGHIGRRLLSYINECRTAARKGLAGKFKHQKPGA